MTRRAGTGEPRPIVVIGAGGTARVVIEAATAAGRRVHGILASGAGELFGARILGDDAAASALADDVDFVVAVGDNWTRKRVVESYVSRVPGVRWATVVHPAAYVASDARLGEGSVVLAGSVVCAGAQVGRHVHFWARAALEHDGTVGDYASLSPGVSTGGGVRIGEGSVIGVGASVIHGVTIGAHAVIGAGAAVVGDVPDCVVAVGVPARVTRERTPGERYL